MDKSVEINNLRPARIVTLGCRLNQADTALMTCRLLRSGYFVQSENDAGTPELIIINSCAVTAAAAAKSRQAARRLQKLYPAARVIFTGCAAEINDEYIAGENYLKLGNPQKRCLDEVLKDIGDLPLQKSRELSAENFCENAYGLFPHRTRAFIKIQEGCDNFCSYCIVPYTRGASRSRDFDEVIADCRQAIESGVPEIIITGVNTCNYLDRGRTLTRVIETLCETIPGNWRLRLSSTEPALDNLGLLETMARYPGKVCRFLHLALQHGCDSVLQRMNRHYTTAEFERFVVTARKLIPDIHLGSDVIVGFPGETDAEFESSFEFIKAMKFANLHVFSYSKRSGTPAATMPDQVHEAVKKERHGRLEALGMAMKEEFQRSMQGQMLDVIFETVDKKAVAHGWSDNYIAVSAPQEQAPLGRIVQLKYR